MRSTLAARRRFLTLSLWAFALSGLIILVAVAAARSGGPNQSQLILRLSDLPPGYLNARLQEEQNDETYCARLTDPEDTPPKLAKFVRRNHPRGCIGAYYSLYTVPEQEFAPPVVGTGVLALDSGRAADAGWTVVPILLGRLLHDKVPRELAAPVKIGQATRLFHSKELNRDSDGTTSFLVWRSGNTIANVMVGADSFAEGDRIAAELASRQQAHIQHPTRYTGAERFDGDVPLDDPALEVPVYWLGLNFQPGHGLPSNRFFSGYVLKPYAPTGESSIGLEEARARCSSWAITTSTSTPGRRRPGRSTSKPRSRAYLPPGIARKRGRWRCPAGAARPSTAVTGATTSAAPTKLPVPSPPGSRSAACT